MKKTGTPDISKLRDLVVHLRSPDGCPWDREQRLETVRPYVVEEAHEVAAAIDTGDPAALRSELGDLLFQVVFIARLAEEQGAFDLADVIEEIHQKMVARHPHVFGDESLEDSAAVLRSWEQRKLREEKRESLLGGVPASLPALTAAHRITQKAAGVGFDWSSPQEVSLKIREELDEVETALADEGAESPAVREEIGDLLFAVSNLSRFLHIDPEGALAAANGKFRRRFEAMAKTLERGGISLDQATIEEMDRAWDDVKAAEKRGTEPARG